MEMSFLGSIGHLMAGSGIKKLFEMIYAPKGVEQIMSGKAISRAVRAHLLLDTVLPQTTTAQIDGCRGPTTSMRSRS